MTERYDIIIPVKSVNRLFIENILSLEVFSEVSKIRIGDAGIEKDIRERLCQIPKVIIYDHKDLYSQGASIKALIETVETDFFVYMHGDVRVPKNWFSVMRSAMSKFDFAECARKYQYEYLILDGPTEMRDMSDRPLSGAQMGSTNSVLDKINIIEDDYLFRNEDIVIADLIKQNGGNYGVVNETYHTHQIGFSRKNENITSVEKINVIKEITDKDIHIFQNQICGIVKYLQPTEKYHLWHFDYSLAVIKSFNGDLRAVKGEINKKKRWLFLYHTRPIRLIRIRLKRALKALFSPEKELFE